IFGVRTALIFGFRTAWPGSDLQAHSLDSGSNRRLDRQLLSIGHAEEIELQHHVAIRTEVSAEERHEVRALRRRLETRDVSKDGRPGWDDDAIVRVHGFDERSADRLPDSCDSHARVEGDPQ